MPTHPTVLVFDVNETLSDLSPMARRFEDVGAPGHLAKLWFTTLLRDGFALTAAGSAESFSRLAEGSLRTVLSDVTLARDEHEAVGHVLDGFAQLRLHPDVADGVRQLRAGGYRLVTLSNGAASVAERLLSDAGVRDEFEHLLSVEDAGTWKPAAAAYQYAARVCEVDPSGMLLAAAHPWDTDGAHRAGLSSAWVNRSGGPYPAHFSPADLTVSSLAELPAALAGL